MYDISEGKAMSLRLPKGTTHTLKHHNPYYWYIPEGNEHQATLAIGHARQNTSEETRVDWQTIRTVSPNELIIIPPTMVHSLVNTGETPFYASLVTITGTKPTEHRLTLRDKLLISQPQKQKHLLRPAHRGNV
jgi:mannose-6-phosphate isomerase-like protein (cupin superfamily)